MDVLGHKLVALALAAILPLLAFLLAIPLGRVVKHKAEFGVLILDCINCFGGGVFFGLFLLHAIPEVRHLLEDALLTPEHIHYPVPEILVASGFFLMMVLEIIIHRYISKRSKSKVLPAEGQVCHVAHISTIANDGQPKSEDIVETAINGSLSIGEGNQDNEVDAITKTLETGGGSDVAKLSLVVLLIALSVECIFEGLALGLMDTVAGVWIMFAAVQSHEVSERKGKEIF